MSNKDLNKNTVSAVSYVSKKLGVSMKTAREVIQCYMEYLDERVDIYSSNPSPVRFGVLPIDSQIQLQPGVVFIYGHESAGKTSLAKRIAISAKNQGLNTLYWDTENKLFMHDVNQLEGVAIANATRSLGIKQIVASGLTDMVVVDTLTSMEVRTSTVRRLRAHIPYVILVAQMRDKWATNRSVPACYEPLLSTSHTQIYLTGRERHKVEGVDLTRIQYNIDKYEANRAIENKKGSFILNEGIVDNLYTAYDYLKSRGRVTSIGFNKILDDKDLGGRFKEAIKTKDIAELFMNNTWRSLHKETNEVPNIDLGWYI